MQSLIAHLKSGSNLGPEEIQEAVEHLVAPDGLEETKALFLTELRAKGETADEVAGFAKALLQYSIDPGLGPEQLSGPMIDVCGTGGDKLGLFNVSTTCMFVLAAGGAVVVKHGNRGITSKCGGADVLEGLGIRIDLSPGEFSRCVSQTGLGFLFAPHYHPAFKSIAPVRKLLAAKGITTIFNILGPLLNPVQPPYQLVGVYASDLLPLYARALSLLGRKHAWAVHGDGMDELSTLGPSEVLSVHQAGPIQRLQIDPKIFGFQPADLSQLQGAGITENAAILTGILDGSIQGPKRDLVVLNSAAAFLVAELVPDLAAGICLANEQLSSGRALGKLRELQKLTPRQ